MKFATRLFVGNLPENTEEKDVLSAFSVFGEVSTLDLKTKQSAENECKKFAFVSLSASNENIESCIKHFSNKDFQGSRLYVTRARESFLERLQRERQQTQKKEAEKLQSETQPNLPEKNPVIILGDKLNPKKRKMDNDMNSRPNKFIKNERHQDSSVGDDINNTNNLNNVKGKDKKGEAEKKRMESIVKKRQEFKEKQNIIKAGLTSIDKQQNKKVIFHDDDDDLTNTKVNHKTEDHRKNNSNSLFDDDNEDGDDDLNFEIKKQFEGRKGQKVLDLQSRYKSDKRFTLDERFIDDEEESESQKHSDNEEVEIVHADEKAKQLNILQNVLGITIKSKTSEADNKRVKSKPGMLRFDPQQPDHAKFLAPVETKPESNKKSKKKTKDKQEEINKQEPELDVPKVEVSKEQFYKVSETLKEAIAQPTTFSLRSLFGNNDNDGPQEKNVDYATIETPKEKKKVKHPLDPTEKNPFVYDSSDSDTEEPEKEKQIEVPPTTESKATWKENLFFSESDPRLKDGLAFFIKGPDNEVHKERRELKSLVKKRIYNKDRKNQMFKKKIGGRKKSMKKPYKNKN